MAASRPLLIHQTTKLNTGAVMPTFGFGTYQLEGSDVEVVGDAIAAGFRHIDCARVYDNEPAVGDALEKALSAADAKVTRGDLFITSKLWNSDHAVGAVADACRQSIADLRCGYLDLYLIHWPVSWAHIDPMVLWPGGDDACTFMQLDSTPLEDTWREMEKLVDAGLVRAIGLSNCSEEQVAAICAVARIKPAVNQVEVHAALPQVALRKSMAALGVHVQAYSPLAIIADPVVKEIAAGAHPPLTPAALLLSHVASLGVTVLTKTSSRARIAEAAALAVPPLMVPDEEIFAKLEAFGRANPRRTCNPEMFLGTPNTPFFS